MPRLSILIPCVGGAAEFDATLVSVLQHRPADCEVLVAHTEAYDDPYDLASEVQFLEANSKARLVELVNEGLAATTGEIVHILACGALATDGWTEAALQRFDDPEIAAVSPLVMNEDGTRLVAAGVRWTLGGSRQVVADRRLMSPGAGRLRAKVLGPTLTAGFFRRDVLQALGGFDSAMDEGHADVELALAIASLKLLTVCEPGSRVALARDQIPERPATFSRGRSAERLFWRHAERQGKTASLLMHPFALLGDIAATRSGLGTIAAGLGRLFALLERSALAKHEQRLEAARGFLAEASEEQATICLPTPAARTESRQAQRRAA